MVMIDFYLNFGLEGGGFFEVYDKGIMLKYFDIIECRFFFFFFYLSVIFCIGYK